MKMYLTTYETQIRKELRKLHFTTIEANSLIRNYPKTIAHGEMLGSFAHFIAFQITLADMGKEAHIQD